MAETLNILLIDDDEDSFLLTRQMLSAVEGRPARLDWAATYQEGVEAISRGEHDVYLIDYQLDGHDGLELLHEAIARGCQSPMIMLTGLQHRDIDIQAMDAGAADYIVKDNLDAAMLERSIRHALERHRLQQTLRERAERLQSLAAELSQAEQRERSRVARLLHDHLQQILAGIKMQVERLATDNSPRRIRAALDLVDEVFNVSRTLSAELSPPILMDVGLAPALVWLQRWMQDQHRLHVKTQVDPEAEPASEFVRFTLFHAVRELLTYLARQAHAREVTLTMSPEGPRLRIVVLAHEAQLESQSPQKEGGYDVSHLRERLQLIDGELNVSAMPDHACRIIVIAPRQPFDSSEMPPVAVRERA